MCQLGYAGEGLSLNNVDMIRFKIRVVAWKMHFVGEIKKFGICC